MTKHAPKTDVPKADERLKAALGGLSSSGRNVSDKARQLAQASKAAAPSSTTAVPAGPAEPIKPSRKAPRPAAKVKKRMGRPPLPEPAEQRTITFTEDLLDALEKFAEDFSGKRRGFKRPSLSETVRVALRMWVEHDWTKEEMRNAWLNAAEVDGEETDE
jgi:hypothetical protein